MLEEKETLTGHLTGTGSISGSVGSKSAINAIVNNGVVVPEEIDPTVPSYVKEITQEDIARWNEVDLSNVYTKQEIDNKKYLTSVPGEYVTETELNNKKYVTQTEASEYATKEELNTKAEATHTHSQYLTEVPSEFVTESELNNKGYATKEDLKDIDVDLTDYYTKTEIDNKGYLTKDDVGDLDIDVNSISDEVIDEIINFQITNANEVAY